MEAGEPYPGVSLSDAESIWKFIQADNEAGLCHPFLSLLHMDRGFNFQHVLSSNSQNWCTISLPGIIDNIFKTKSKEFLFYSKKMLLFNIFKKLSNKGNVETITLILNYDLIDSLLGERKIFVSSS